jgi:hypoxanthine phosphoribosyltransferase
MQLLSLDSRRCRLEEKTYQRRFVSYDQFGELMDRLVDKIKKSGKRFSSVYGIARGGLPIAVHLSHHLGIMFYSDRELPPLDMTSLLIVDDLTCDGTTMLRIKSQWKHASTAVLFHKPHAAEGSEPDFYVYMTEDWIDFPWEDPTTTPNRERYKKL